MELVNRAGRRMRLLGNALGLRSAKVFAIGFNKTGTTSLHALFESLARPSFHGVEWRSSARSDLWRRYDCFSDGVPEDFRLLDRSFPGARFILQVRELAPWVYSRLAHIEREKARGTHGGLPGWDTTADSVQAWVRRRNEHHLQVMEYFADRPGDLLVLNFTRDADSATRVARFIGHDRAIARPERNRKSEKSAPASHQALMDGCVAELGLEAADLERDLLCAALLTPAQRERFPLDTSELATR